MNLDLILDRVTIAIIAALIILGILWLIEHFVSNKPIGELLGWKKRPQRGRTITCHIGEDGTLTRNGVEVKVTIKAAAIVGLDNVPTQVVVTYSVGTTIGSGHFDLDQPHWLTLYPPNEKGYVLLACAKRPGKFIRGIAQPYVVMSLEKPGDALEIVKTAPAKWLP